MSLFDFGGSWGPKRIPNVESGSMEPATAKQPAPKGSGPDIADLVIADIRARKAEGEKKYGEPLRAFNGRSALVDAYQEALDLAQYLRQAIEERDQLASGREWVIGPGSPDVLHRCVISGPPLGHGEMVIVREAFPIPKKESQS